MEGQYITRAVCRIIVAFSDLKAFQLGDEGVSLWLLNRRGQETRVSAGGGRPERLRLISVAMAEEKVHQAAERDLSVRPIWLILVSFVSRPSPSRHYKPTRNG